MTASEDSASERLCQAFAYNIREAVAEGWRTTYWKYPSFETTEIAATANGQNPGCNNDSGDKILVTASQAITAAMMPKELANARLASVWIRS